MKLHFGLRSAHLLDVPRRIKSFFDLRSREDIKTYLVDPNTFLTTCYTTAYSDTRQQNRRRSPTTYTTSTRGVYRTIDDSNFKILYRSLMFGKNWNLLWETVSLKNNSKKKQKREQLPKSDTTNQETCTPPRMLRSCQDQVQKDAKRGQKGWKNQSFRSLAEPFEPWKREKWEKEDRRKAETKTMNTRAENPKEKSAPNTPPLLNICLKTSN